ncbi:MAG TPA: SEC-C metal-binding domain-containing protein [Planctomycetota bacterium]
MIEKPVADESFESLGVRMIRPGVWVADGTRKVWVGHPRDRKLLEYGDPDVLARILRDEADENAMPADFPHSWSVTFPRADGKLGVSFRGEAAGEVMRHMASGGNAGEFVKQQAGRMPGPNEPCPCKSGKKFKRCCGRFA